MSNYTNTPGVSVELVDGQLSLSTAETSGRNLLLIGEVPTGVSSVPNEPTLIRNESELIRTFGDFHVSGKDNQLAIEWQAARQETKANIYLLAIKGNSPKEKFIDLYHQLNGYMRDLRFDHVALLSLYADEVTDVLTKTDFLSPEDQESFPGLAGVIKSTAVEETDQYVGSPSHLLARYAETQSLTSNDTIAYIGVKPPTNYGVRDISTYVEKLVGRDNEVSKYLNVVTGPHHAVSVSTSLSPKWAFGVALYAAQVSNLPITVAPTNQKLKSVNRLRWMYSPRQIDQLIGNKYVVSTLKSGSAIIVDAVTSAPDVVVGSEKRKSDFTRLSTLRSINYLVSRIRTTCDSYIGTVSSFPTYNALRTSIKSEIEGAIGAGVIQDATYTLNMGDSFDSVEVSLQVIPTFELRTINVVIGLSNPTNYEIEEK